ncbi:hypothetical protein JIN84_14155 [Luteolibacter yonseiensis]|uniref:Uncharacterized protein n=1 Tax=Luteolibacter yonseiensis TaxID=1144680 RepID=A0A934R7A8_9BACT|nr:hypothetical protein [Luteolibacter yonseiensis]MBK1816765.1 hypothetical protein [Luteolibacter yonseiensis]
MGKEPGLMNKSLIGIPIGCVSAAVMGYLLARQSSGVAGSDAEISSQPKNPSEMQAAAHGTRTPESLVKIRSAAQLAALKEDLRQRLKNSPTPDHDWGLRERVAAVLTTMSPQELEGFAKETLPVNMNTTIRSWPMMYGLISKETLRQWCLKDPAGACQSLATIHLGAMAGVFRQWQQRDPEAAQAWLERANFPQKDDEIKAMLKRNFLTQQVMDHFSAARESLGQMTPEAQKQTLEEWSKLVAHDPAKRDELLSLLANRGDGELTEKCYQKLIGEMADKSPNEAANFIESTTLDEELKNKLNDQVLGDWAMKDPVRAFAKWAELERGDAPPALFPALFQWSINSPGAEQALEWAKKLPPGAVSDQFKLQLIQGWGGGRFHQAAELSASLEDPRQRIRQMKLVRRNWQTGWPDGEKAWFQKLPQADKEALEKPLE